MFQATFLALVLFLLLFPLTTSGAAEVELSWDCSTETNLIGYKLYRGPESKRYSPHLTVVVAPQCDMDGRVHYIVQNLPFGVFYWAVTAYNADGESEFSDEVMQVITEETLGLNPNELASKVPMPPLAKPTGLRIDSDSGENDSE